MSSNWQFDARARDESALSGMPVYAAGQQWPFAIKIALVFVAVMLLAFTGVAAEQFVYGSHPLSEADLVAMLGVGQ